MDIFLQGIKMFGKLLFIRRFIKRGRVSLSKFIRIVLAVHKMFLVKHFMREGVNFLDKKV